MASKYKSDNGKFEHKSVNLDREPDFFAEIWLNSDIDKGIWYIPGTFPEKTSHYCGTFKKISTCVEHKTFTKVHIKACKILGCPSCFTEGINDRALRVEHKLREYYRLYGRVIRHYVISEPTKETEISPADYNFPKKKAMAIALLKKFTYGGVLFFHPYRYNKEDKTMKFSPHFHAMAAGPFIEWTNELAKEHNCELINKGWRSFENEKGPVFSWWKYQEGKLVKRNKKKEIAEGITPSPVFRTIKYILSHTGLEQANYVLKVPYVKRDRKPLVSKRFASQFKQFPESKEAIIKKKLISKRQKNCYWYYSEAAAGMKIDHIENRQVPEKCPICNKTLLESEEKDYIYTNGKITEISHGACDIETVCEANTITEIEIDKLHENNELSPMIQLKKIKIYIKRDLKKPLVVISLKRLKGPS